jgi:hypothetical protein
MTDFETFLRAVERLPEEQRLLVMGDECVIYPPEEDLGYESTPKDSLAFGAMGVDGVHYLILKLDGKVRDESPVIYFSPMDFSNPYTLLGHSFRQYLAAACSVTEKEIGAIIDKERQGETVLADFIRCNLDHSLLDLDGFGSQIKQYSHLLPPVDA